MIGSISNGEAVVWESKQSKMAFSEGYCFLKSAKAVLDLMHSRSEQTLLGSEIRSFSSDIVKRISTFSDNGTQKNVFLSAICADGFRNFLRENFKDYYVISIETEVGDASYRVMEEVMAACRLRNADMIVCPCPMNPHMAEHLVFPSANLALVTSNTYHCYPDADEIVPFSDFTTAGNSDSDTKMIYDSLLGGAVRSFDVAKEHHNRLEAIYKTVTNYSAIKPLYQKALDFLTL